MRGRPDAIRRGAAAASSFIAVAVVVAAPLPFGSIEQPWPALWSGLMGLSLALAGPVRLPGHVRQGLLGLCVLATAWILVLAVQGSQDPNPAFAFEWPGDLGLALRDVPRRVSAGGQSPFLAAGPALLMALTFGRFAMLGAEPGGADRTFRAIRWGAVAIGLVSFALFVLDPGRLLGRTKVFYGGSFTGTFVNRNTAAAFFGTACLLWAGHLRELMPSGLSAGGGSLVGTLVRVTDRLNGAVMVRALACVSCLGFAAMTGSRAGFLLTALLLPPVLAWGGGGRRRSAAIPGALAFGGIVALVLTVGGLVGSRLSVSGLVDLYRWEIYRLCLTLVERQPWLGIGLGQFETVLPAIRTPALGMRGVWEFGHSTPLELAVEVGLPLALATMLAWVAVAARMLRAGHSRRVSRIRRPALAVLTFGALHSLIDFPLQVPGYAIVFAAVVACGWSRSPDVAGVQFGNTRSET